MYVYGASLFYVCCSFVWGSVGMFVVLAAVVKDSVF